MKTASACRSAREALHASYRRKIEINPRLNRSLVSYQSNRRRPFYRWFKYKEGFSASLVEYVLHHVGRCGGTLLDPFAGSGAALFAGRELGWTASGIELLPVGIAAFQARLAAGSVDATRFASAVAGVKSRAWKYTAKPGFAFQHLRITEGAFPAQTEDLLARYRTYIHDEVQDADVRRLLDFAAFSVLEAVSFTRKDGQYLRWDGRAPRKLAGKPFDKGRIPSIQEAVESQLRTMLEDLSAGDLFSSAVDHAADRPSIIEGSCLKVLPELPSGSIDAVITSPPYCNRYDYTRTYALELAYLGVDEERLRELRQEMLSCTVENRPKVDALRESYGMTGHSTLFADALQAFEEQAALQEVLALLDQKREQDALNNANVPRMVRNYFLEMAVVVFELARLVRRGGCVVMVNDNVQYAGEEVPVDLILCDIAARAGFDTEVIWTLGRGKGNSSQQMGAHGRNELRKCAYVWKRG